MKTIAIVGGFDEKHAKEIGGGEYRVLFNDGLKNRKHQYEHMIKKADFIVVMIGAISHAAMFEVKKWAKQWNKPILFYKGYGFSSLDKKLKQIS